MGFSDGILAAAACEPPFVRGSGADPMTGYRCSRGREGCRDGRVPRVYGRSFSAFRAVRRRGRACPAPLELDAFSGVRAGRYGWTITVALRFSRAFLFVFAEAFQTCTVVGRLLASVVRS